MSSDGFQFVPWYRDLFDKIKFPLSKDLAILDFGCGTGECVRQFRDVGYTAFGCDVEFPGNLVVMDPKNWTLPLGVSITQKRSPEWHDEEHSIPSLKPRWCWN